MYGKEKFAYEDLCLCDRPTNYDVALKIAQLKGEMYNTPNIANGKAFDALDVRMTSEWRAEISALSIEPPPAKDRFEEKL